MNESSGSTIWKKYGPQMLSISIVMIGLIVFFAIIEFNLTEIDFAKC